jgi:hypothetical protein
VQRLREVRHGYRRLAAPSKEQTEQLTVRRVRSGRGVKRLAELHLGLVGSSLGEEKARPIDAPLCIFGLELECHEIRPFRFVSTVEFTQLGRPIEMGPCILRPEVEHRAPHGKRTLVILIPQERQ